MPVPPAEDSAKSLPDECPLCHDTGVIRWQQPSPDGVLRNMEHPCINGCGGTWKHPAAERDQVVDAPGELPHERDHAPTTRVRGLADEANGVGTDFITAFVRARGFDWGNDQT